MHMADALISPAVGGAMMVAAGGALAYSVKKVHRDLEEKNIPIMGVMGAFVFAAQMINFTIPATGSSGHIGGGILLAALLGPYAGLLVITSVLAIQALVFADGGLLALGCNIVNMGVIPCLVAYPFIYKQITKKNVNNKTITLGSMLAVVVGLQLGALGVVLQTVASGKTELPFAMFLALMQPIHLAIGIAEGVITAGVLCFIFKVSPELLAATEANKKHSRKKVAIYMIVATMIIGGVVSWYASSNPDGLEWSIGKVIGGELENPDTGIHNISSSIQDKVSLMPDYQSKDKGTLNENAQTSLAGILGSIAVLIVVALASIMIKKIKGKSSAQHK